MRWQVLLQAGIGVFALFGFAYVAVEPKIGPLVDELSEERARHQARVAVLEVERSWGRSRLALGRTLDMMIRSRTVADLGQSLPEDTRWELLEKELQKMIEPMGSDVKAVLVDGDGGTLVGAALLATATALNDARSGSLSTRVEMIGDEPMEVVAAPIVEEKGSRRAQSGKKHQPVASLEPMVVGALALARPLGRLRLSSWTVSLPTSSLVVILNGSEPVASLLSRDQLAAVRHDRLPPKLEVDQKHYVVAQTGLGSDRDPSLRVVALAPVHSVYNQGILDAVRLLVLALAGISFLLTAALILLVPNRPRRGTARLSTAEGRRDVPTGHQGAEWDNLPTGGSTSSPLMSGTQPRGGHDAPLPHPMYPPPTPMKMDTFGTYSGVPLGAAERLPSQQVDVPPTNTVDSVTDSFDALRGSTSTPYRGVPPPDHGSSDMGFRRPEARSAEVGFHRPGMRSEEMGFYHPEVRSAETGFHRPETPSGELGYYSPASGAPDVQGHSPRVRSSEFEGRPGVGAYRGRRSGPVPGEDNGRAPNRSRSDEGPAVLSDQERTAAASDMVGGLPDSPAAGSYSSSESMSFDALAQAALVSAPAMSHSEIDEDLPVPKGGLSPGMIAAQGLVHHGSVMAPSPRLEDNLPLPKEQAAHLYDLSPSSSTHTARSVRDTEGDHGPFSEKSSHPTDRTEAYDHGHYRQVFDAFVAAKTELGESTDGLTFERFGAKLKASEEGLIEQHGCRAVRFQVIRNEHTISLRPQLVR